MAAFSAREMEHLKPQASKESQYHHKGRIRLPGDDTFDESYDSEHGNVFGKTEMRRMGMEQQLQRKFEMHLCFHKERWGDSGQGDSC